MRRLPGKLWMRDACAGIVWQHRLVSYPILRKLADGDCYAISIEADQAVYYHKDESDESLRLLYLHESHHRSSMVPGEVHTLHKIYGSSDEEIYNEREEMAAVFYARALNESFGKYLKLPKVPR